MPLYHGPEKKNSGDKSKPLRLAPSKRWRSLTYIGIPVGAALVVGAIGGVLLLRNYVYEELAPQVSTALTKLIQRPVKVGAVEAFSLTGVRFGASEVPATPTDRDRATAKAVDVRFNLLSALWTRTIAMDVTLVQPQLYVEQDPDGQWLKTKLAEPEPPGWLKQELDALRLQDATVTVLSRTRQGTLAEPVELSQINGSADLTYAVAGGTLLDNNPIDRVNFDAKAKLGDRASKQLGNLTIKGEFVPTGQRLALTLQGETLPLPTLARVVGAPVEVRSGELNTSLEARFQANQPANLRGRLSVDGVTAKAAGLPQLMTGIQGNLRFRDQLIIVEEGKAVYATVPIQLAGSVHLAQGYNLGIQVKPTNLATVAKNWGAKLPIALAGEAKADLKVLGPIAKPFLTGTLAATKPVQIDKLTFSTLQATLQANPQTVVLTNMQAMPTVGGRITGQAQLQLGQTPRLISDLRADRVPGDAIASLYGKKPDFTIGPITARVQTVGSLPLTAAAPPSPGKVTTPSASVTPKAAEPLRSLVQWQAPLGTYPTSGEALISQGNALLRNLVMRVGGGSLVAQGRVVGDRWQAAVQANQLNLYHFSKDLRGQLNGQFTAAGRTTSFRAADIQGRGQLNLSQGLGAINQPIAAMVGWDGKTIQVQQAKTNGLEARGLIFTQPNPQGTPTISRFDLAVRASNYRLRDLAMQLPAGVDLRGRADMAARITGTPAAPNVAGQLRLRNLGVNQIAFEPVMQGAVRFTTGQGGELTVNGQRDRIALSLDRSNKPQSFDIRWDQATAVGRTQGDRLAVSVTSFPIAALGLQTPSTPTVATAGKPGAIATASTKPAAPLAGLPLRGSLSGVFNLNLSQNNGTGSIAVAKPSLGHILGDQFTANFDFGKDFFKLNQGELRLGESRYAMTGQFRQGAEPAFKGQVEVKQGNVQDILKAMQWFDLTDIARGLQPPVYTGTATTVAPVAVDVANAPLINQLRRLVEIQTLLAQQQARRRELSPLPELNTLAGNFGGKIDLAASLKSGLKVDFNLRGQDWTWDTYKASQVLATGRFENGILTLTPLRIQSDQSLLAFSGQVGGDAQSGQLRMENVPVQAIQAIVPLPLNMTGNLNGSAVLSGSFANPRARGVLTLDQGTLNQTPIQTAQAGFSYGDSRLTFDGKVQVSSPEPLTIQASVPYQMPVKGSLPPASDQLSLDVNVRNEGLALLNLLTQGQVSWEKGQGQVNLKVAGTTHKPIATGTANFTNAVIRARALPEPMTDVTGTAKFDGDRIRVDSLQAKFSGGTLAMNGVLPIVSLSTTSNDFSPLTLTMQKLALNLKGLYRGKADGQVQVIGSALQPYITGQINLADGSIFLPEGGSAAVAKQPTTQANFFSPPEFRDLKLVVGDRVQLAMQPILAFRGTGELTLNGPFDNIQPNGTINVRFGQVNLLSSQFTLVRTRPNTARFIPNRGLDPELNIQLKTSSTEVTRRPIQSPNSSEIADVSATNLGALQTIRIFATIEGPASQLLERLTLSSSPARSETELYGLLGFGGLASGVDPSNGTLALANLAGSTLFNLGNIQALVGDAIGLSEFRLFPTTIRQDKDGKRTSQNQTSALDLAAEIGFDLPRGFSFSVLQVLTADVPTQFSIRYRVNDNFLIRASSDFAGDERAAIEYEARF